MKLRQIFSTLLLLGCTALAAPAQPTGSSADSQHANDAAAAAATATGNIPPAPDFLEHLVDGILELFDVRSSGNTVTHYAIAALLLVGAFFLRHILTKGVFGLLKRFARHTETTLDDELFGALEQPAATVVMVGGIVASLKVLKLSRPSDDALHYGSTIAFSLVVFWGLLRAFDTLLDHAQAVAQKRQMGVAAFMPWIKKTLIAIFVVFGVLMVVQSLGYDVKALLAGLGIGGLAFALAAQDTIANLFGSLVVAIDQPFKLGETVTIGVHTGTVEDIGLRSTKLRKVDKSLAILPNKAVASESIVNLSRFTQRRAEFVISLTYDTKAEQMDAIVADIRELLAREPDLDPAGTNVYFRDLNASSLDIWITYLSRSPDFGQHMAQRQRLNLAIMRAVETRGLAFAFPTQTLHVPEPIVQKLAPKS